jgi:hypothetical protein
MDIKDSTVIIRPEMAAPEIDDYDEVLISVITGNIEIGSKISYTLSDEAVPHRDETINRHD